LKKGDIDFNKSGGKMQIQKCPLCEKRVYSGVGTGCKMCGMLLDEQEIEFCSDDCEDSYKEISREVRP